MPVRALKLLVVVMGIMIVGGFAVLLVMIAGRLSRGGSAPSPSIAAAPVELPAGARVEAMSIGADRLAVDVVLADGSRQIVIFDLATGRRLGTIPLRVSR